MIAPASGGRFLKSVRLSADRLRTLQGGAAKEPMSTISPFVRIEGSISQPQPRASRHVPRPFGSEWALLPLEGSLPVQLGAFLRTVCLQDETIWSMCHWVSARPEQPSEPLSEPRHSIARPTGASAPPVASVASAMRMAPVAPGSRENRVGMRAAGACAIGGAAICAWIVIGYLAQRHMERDATSAPQRDLAKDAPARVPPLSVGPHEITQKRPQVASPPHPVEARHARRRMSETSRAGRHPAHHPASQTIGAARRLSTVASSSTASQRVAPQAMTHRSLARSSAAGEYSPFAPVRLGIDEYASVTMPTDARPHNTVVAQPTVHRGNSADTEWMSHISQRRVTEVPNEFSK